MDVLYGWIRGNPEGYLPQPMHVYTDFMLIAIVLQSVIPVAGILVSVSYFSNQSKFKSHLKSLCKREDTLLRSYNMFIEMDDLLTLSTVLTIIGTMGCLLMSTSVNYLYPCIGIAYAIVIVTTILTINYLFRYLILYERKGLLTCCKAVQYLHLFFLLLSAKQVSTNDWLMKNHPIPYHLLVLEIICAILVILYIQWKSMAAVRLFRNGFPDKVNSLWNDKFCLDDKTSMDCTFIKH